jgi:hypothetical protein
VFRVEELARAAIAEANFKVFLENGKRGMGLILVHKWKI